MTRRILVTGGNGFVGRACFEALAKMSEPVVYTYRTQPIEGREDHGICLDLNNEQAFQDAAEKLRDITDIVHTAAYVPDRKKDASGFADDYQNNVTGNLATLGNLLKNFPNLERIVLMSSCYVLNKDPAIGLYGVGKLIAEQVVHRAGTLRGFNTIALRFPQLYGPGESHGIYANIFVEKAVRGETIQLDQNALQQKDLVYIGDVAASVIHALGMEGHETVTISSPQAYSIKEVAEIVVDETGADKELLRVSDQLNEPPSVLHFASDYEQLGFRLQYSLRDGIEETIKYYRGKMHV